MSKVHVNQIRSVLEKEYQGLVDVADCNDWPKDQQESNFLTRALAAYALSLAADVTPALAAQHVVDGFNDNGIDALYFDSAQHRLYLVQSKWSHAGNSTPDAGDVHKFLQGFRDILEPNLSAFNEKFQALKDEAWAAVHDPHGRFTLVLAHTGLQSLAPAVRGLIDDELATLNDASEIAVFQQFSQKDLHESLSARVEGAPINFDDLLVFDWGLVSEPLRAYYGKCAASDVAGWLQKYGERLFAKNLRKVIGNSEINKEITDSLLKDPERFWYLNNGITVIAQSVDKKAVGGADRATGSFTCTGVSVVNGAQTVGAISRAFEMDPEKVKRAKVAARFIQCPNEFAAEVTKAANTQNRIENKDFAALDPTQQRLWRELLIEQKEYAYRTGEEAPAPDRGCTIEEATAALACAHGEVSYAVIAKSAIGRFWSDIKKPPYTVLFNDSVTGPRLWRTVEVLRAVEATMTVAGKRNNKKEALVAVHGNRFVAHQVFKRLPAGVVADSTRALPDLLEEARRLAVDSLERTATVLNESFPKAYLQSLFKNAARCKEVDSKMDRGALGVTLPLPWPATPSAG